jgi:NADPH-dependent 2,4-dienoyl-CoA reductase/sulfur reductase-like enzyme
VREGAEHYDVLVIGGGPAGLAAGAVVAGAGLSVALVDERATLGGQIYKQPGQGFEVRSPAGLGRDYMRGRALIDAIEQSGARLLTRTSAVAIERDEVVLLEEGKRTRAVTARRILLAPGAHDRPVVFPGWTLPGVITAGGAQTLVKTQRILPGREIVFAGSGPLALAFPAQLRDYGANVTLVLEAGPAPGPRDLLRMARAAAGNGELLRDAARYRSTLLRSRTPLRYRRIVVRAEGDERVEAVVHAAVDRDWRVVPGSEQRTAADALCVGYGFFPSVELLRLAGCELGYDEDLGGPIAVRDAWMRTTVPGVFAAGDGTGVSGSHVAIAEGRLAALAIALDLGALDIGEVDRRARPIRSAMRRKLAFARSLRGLHAIGRGIYELATEDTVVCRCEGVTRGQLDGAVDGTGDISVVKGLTRAGMGLCQGRNCQRQIASMIATRHARPLPSVPFSTPRFPVRPVPIGAFAEAIEDDGFFTPHG